MSDAYSWLKLIHILSATVMVGTGFGSAFYKWRTDASGNLEAMVVVNRYVVLADWIFTTPSVIIQPITGWLMMRHWGWGMEQTWLMWALGLYVLIGLCWLPVVFLQIWMRDMGEQALATGTPLPAAYGRYARGWFWLGMPAFSGVLVIYYLMVFRPFW